MTDGPLHGTGGSAAQRAAEPMLPLIRDLCAIRTGVVAEGNQTLFDRIAQELPLRLHRRPCRRPRS